jgi:ABC-2 type transport system ATP-binding protein
MKALEISGVNFSYDNYTGKSDDKAVREAGAYVLRNFTMSVETGDIHALLGPNGAGKTTLMRIITGQLRGYTGTVNIYGRPVTDNIALNSFGFAPQPISVFTALTARENLRFFGVMAGLPHDLLQQRIREVLEQTGLGEYVEKRVATYSGGMLRRLNLRWPCCIHPGCCFWMNRLSELIRKAVIIFTKL